MTTQTTPATSTSTSTKLDRALLIQAVAVTITKAFEPEDKASGVTIPFNVVTADERRVYALLAAQLYTADGKTATAQAWRVQHAYEAGCISSPAKWRYVAREALGDDITKAEKETREVFRQMAQTRIAERQAAAAERQAAAAERQAEAIEILLRAFLVREGSLDIHDIRAAYAKMSAERASARVQAAEAPKPEVTGEKAAEAKAAEAKAA